MKNIVEYFEGCELKPNCYNSITIDRITTDTFVSFLGYDKNSAYAALKSYLFDIHRRLIVKNEDENEYHITEYLFEQLKKYKWEVGSYSFDYIEQIITNLNVEPLKYNRTEVLYRLKQFLILKLDLILKDQGDDYEIVQRNTN